MDVFAIRHGQSWLDAPYGQLYISCLDKFV